MSAEEVHECVVPGRGMPLSAAPVGTEREINAHEKSQPPFRNRSGGWLYSLPPANCSDGSCWEKDESRACYALATVWLWPTLKIGPSAVMSRRQIGHIDLPRLARKQWSSLPLIGSRRLLYASAYAARIFRFTVTDRFRESVALAATRLAFPLSTQSVDRVQSNCRVVQTATSVRGSSRSEHSFRRLSDVRGTPPVRG